MSTSSHPVDAKTKLPVPSMVQALNGSALVCLGAPPHLTSTFTPLTPVFFLGILTQELLAHQLRARATTLPSQPASSFYTRRATHKGWAVGRGKARESHKALDARILAVLERGEERGLEEIRRAMREGMVERRKKGEEA